MSKVRVFRVEDKSGNGPYWDYALPEMGRSHTDSDHPCAFEDFGAKFNPNHHFAFDALEKAEEWFRGYAETLTNAGFLLHEYEVDSRFVMEGCSGKQVTFNRKFATLIGEGHAPNTLWA